jgi:hypothetical protein
MKRLSDEQRDKIILAFENGLSDQVEIAAALNISQWSVCKTIMNHKHSKCPTSQRGWNFCPFCGINFKKSYWR